MVALKAPGDLPMEYIEYKLCTEMYHCRPSELENEDWFTLLNHLACREQDIKYG